MEKNFADPPWRDSASDRARQAEPMDDYAMNVWFLNMSHAPALIEAWRREHNDERPKKALGGLTPAAYAKQLAESATVATDPKHGCYSNMG